MNTKELNFGMCDTPSLTLKVMDNKKGSPLYKPYPCIAFAQVVFRLIY